MDTNLKDTSLYINRELSWLEFNQRVLEEAQDETNPLLERLKFLCIVSSNLDEFFMVRVAGLIRDVESGTPRICPAGMTPRQQLDAIAERTHRMVADQYRCLKLQLLPGLAENGIRLLDIADLDAEQMQYLSNRFDHEIYPVLSVIAVDEIHPFPLVQNLSLHLAFRLRRRDDDADDLLALTQIPGNLPRLVPLPARRGHDFVLLDEVVRHFLGRLCTGREIIDSAVFRISRDSELEFDDEGGINFLQRMETKLRERRRNEPIRLEVEEGVSPGLLTALQEHVDVKEEAVYRVAIPVDLRALMRLLELPGYPSLRDAVREPRIPPPLLDNADIFAVLRERDILLHHPFDSFEPVIDLLEAAADDEDVLAIKQTLYRTSGDSPIIKALIRAAENGKGVTVLVELMARFDEARNVTWAKQLEEAGAHVIYGLQGLKTHAKILMVVRRDQDGVRRYLHFSTGNYNDKTARLYTDLGLMTTDEALGVDASGFFNTITGYSDPPHFQKLVMAPTHLRDRLISLIERETMRAKAGEPAHIITKMNSLADPRLIQALYRASRSGVRIELNVRGVCCLRPGVPGVSENITVVSIVDRYLEHSRLFYFLNGGEEQMFLSSADWMPRNLDRRVELMVPLEQENIRQRAAEILGIFFRDRVRARRLRPDGLYERLTATDGEDSLRCQEYLHEVADRDHHRLELMTRSQFVPEKRSEH